MVSAGIWVKNYAYESQQNSRNARVCVSLCVCLCESALRSFISTDASVSLLSLTPSWIHICEESVNQCCITIDSSSAPSVRRGTIKTIFLPQRRGKGSADGSGRALCCGPADRVLMIHVSFLEHLFQPPVVI